MAMRWAVARPLRSLPTPLARQRRFASHDSHDHHHAESHDTNQYPKEGFNNPFWRNLAIGTVSAVVLYNFLPSDFLSASWEDIDSAPWLTRVIAHYAPSQEQFQAINQRNLDKVDEYAERERLFASAKMRPKAPFTDTLLFERYSPHKRPVGGMPDMKDLVIKE